MKTTYIYGIRDLEIGKYIYVGKSNKPTNRFASHLKCSDIKYLREYIQEKSRSCFGLEILEKVEFEVNRGWVKREKFWVRKLRREEHRLLNKNDGGQGPTEVSEESKARNSKSQKKLWTLVRRKEKSKQMSGANNPNYGKLGEDSHMYGKIGYWAGTEGANPKPYPTFFNIGTKQTIEAGKNLKKLCCELGLNFEAMRMVARGHNKQTRDGWILSTEEARLKAGKDGLTKLYPAFYNEKRNRFIPIGLNLFKLCHDQNLNYDTFYNLKSGNTKQSQDGWRLATENEIVEFNGYDKLNGGYC